MCTANLKKFLTGIQISEGSNRIRESKVGLKNCFTLLSPTQRQLDYKLLNPVYVYFNFGVKLVPMQQNIETETHTCMILKSGLKCEDVRILIKRTTSS